MPRIIGVKDGSQNASYSRDTKTRTIKKTFEMVYTILADNSIQNEEDIRVTQNLPYVGLVLRGAACNRVKVKEEDSSALHWSAHCSFDSTAQPESEEDDENDTPPDQRTPEIEWTFETLEEVLEQDAITEEPIVNSINEPIVVTAPLVVPVLTVKKFQNSFDPDVILRYANHVNSGTFYGAPAKAALMAGIQDKPVEINGQTWREVTYFVKFKIRKDTGDNLKPGWQLQLMNHATRHVLLADDIEDPTKWESFKDKDGNLTTGHISDGVNALLHKGADNTGEDPVFLSFNRFPEADFDNLTLGPF